jgi:hypothetical protein
LSLFDDLPTPKVEVETHVAVRLEYCKSEFATEVVEINVVSVVPYWIGISPANPRDRFVAAIVGAADWSTHSVL